METTEAILEAYIRVLPWEISAENIVREGYLVLLRLDLGPCAVRVRRVRVYGVVEGLSASERRVDFTVRLGEAGVLVRAWQENMDVVEGVEEGTWVEVFGTLRLAGEVVYVSPLIVREKRLDWTELVKRDREVLAEAYCGGGGALEAGDNSDIMARV